MEATKRAVSEIVDYDRLSSVSAADPPEVARTKVGMLISTPQYDKAMKRAQTKIKSINEKLAGLKAQIRAQEEIIMEAKKQTSYVDRTSQYSVDSYNKWVVRLNAAIDRRTALVEKHDDAVDDAKERVAELEEAALEVIDEDIVTAMQKLVTQAQRFAGREDSVEVLAAIETSFLTMKLYAVLEDVIDSTSARREAKELNAEVGGLFVDLCGRSEVRNAISDAWRRSTFLNQSNIEQKAKIEQLVADFDLDQMKTRVATIEQAIKQRIDTDIPYATIVDPSELSQADHTAQSSIAAARKLGENLGTLQGESQTWQQEVDNTANAVYALQKSMTAAVDAAGELLLTGNTFLDELLDEDVIDDFLLRDLQAAARDLRAHVSSTVGDAAFEQLVSDTTDRWSLISVDAIIKATGFERLAAGRKAIPGAIAKVQEALTRLDEIRAGIREQPNENAQEVEQKIASIHTKALLPLIGLAAAGENKRVIVEYESGLASDHEVYRALVGTLLAKHTKTIRLMPIMAAIFGILGAVGGFMLLSTLELMPRIGVAAGVAAILAGAYIVTMAMLKSAEKMLQGFSQQTPS